MPNIHIIGVAMSEKSIVNNFDEEHLLIILKFILRVKTGQRMTEVGDSSSTINTTESC